MQADRPAAELAVFHHRAAEKLYAQAPVPVFRAEVQKADPAVVRMGAPRGVEVNKPREGLPLVQEHHGFAVPAIMIARGEIIGLRVEAREISVRRDPGVGITALVEIAVPGGIYADVPQGGNVRYPAQKLRRQVGGVVERVDRKAPVRIG